MSHLILHGDCLEVMRNMPDCSVDVVATDPPYALTSGMYKGDKKHKGGFMGKAWDSALPSIEVWREVYRVLRPSGVCFVMSAPRLDVYSHMVLRLDEAGFNVDSDPVLWCYFSGFPKAADVSKLIDKALGVERDVIEKRRVKGGGMEHINRTNAETHDYRPDGYQKGENVLDITAPATDLAKKYDGSKAGYQPKPAFEQIIVAQKPPVTRELNFDSLSEQFKSTFPFICTPKPNKKEKDAGLSEFAEQVADAYAEHRGRRMDEPSRIDGKPVAKGKNIHPTTKPLTLMRALVSLGTQTSPSVVLDPFVGSGTTVCAAVVEGHYGVGIDMTDEYIPIAKARVAHWEGECRT